VHLHGAAGDALAEKGVAVGMTATEVTEWARWLLNQWLSQLAVDSSFRYRFKIGG
jgi:L-serine deaminase